ncbi:tRNA dimethylallyltransferase [Mycolicibacterium fortuitum subsp. acetamidolyticum]|uniref:tRNA dimethylallyltransferase n=1 Tax=Mycolicibacterium fortuitum subsp. acetamidolyticum TaxID=144550 RepID=A0A100WRN1_MYCFO|nr:hypothetical protein [Mycolicibacterium fortuitum]MCV7140380.1 hypothetical protein [Mycolicibacterium fortuitum]GAT02940.1 tRNA dimethylallyltransferase [Mycolicibacterium fortuitum subsp. acetamidolyticum]
MSDYELYDIEDFKPLDGWSVVYACDDGLFGIDPCPGVLILSHVHDDGEREIAAVPAEFDGDANALVPIASNCYGFMLHANAVKLFADATWTFDIGGDATVSNADELRKMETIDPRDVRYIGPNWKFTVTHPNGRTSIDSTSITLDIEKLPYDCKAQIRKSYEQALNRAGFTYQSVD